MTEHEIGRIIDRIRAHRRWNAIRILPANTLFDRHDPDLTFLKFPSQPAFTLGNLVDFLASAFSGGTTKRSALVKDAVLNVAQKVRIELDRENHQPSTPVPDSPNESGADDALRVLRLHKFNPFISDRISDPFTLGSAFLDLEGVNEEAFQTISREIELVTSMGQCRGILVLGEAGTGKTHLLARIRSKLARKVRMLFVPRPTNAESVMSSTWTKILESLNQPLHPTENPETSQADKLLRSAITTLVRRHATEDPGIVFKTRDDINRCCLRIESGAATAEEIDKYGIRNRLLEAFRQSYGTIGQHGNTFLLALLNYVLYRARDRRVRIIEYLRNFEVDDETCQSLGLRPWTSVSDQSSNADICSAREEWALEGIRVISKLATHDKPLVLAFDQVEGLRNKLELTRAWGDTIREIMDQGSNIVVVSCVFPSLWGEWFTMPRDGYAPLEDSVQHRMAATTVELKPFSTAQALELVERRLSSLDERVSRPSRLFPFKSSELETLFSTQSRRAIRLFIQRCSDLFMSRVFAKSDVKAADSPSELLLRFVENRPQLERHPSDPEWVGTIGELIQALTRAEPLPRLAFGTRVVPDHIVYRTNAGIAVLGVINARGTSFTARVRNWMRLRERNPEYRFFLTRSSHRPPPSSASIGGQLVRDLAAEFEVVTEAAQNSLFSWHDAVIAIEEGELWCGEVALTFRDLLAAWDLNPASPLDSGFRSLHRVVIDLRFGQPIEPEKEFSTGRTGPPTTFDVLQSRPDSANARDSRNGHIPEEMTIIELGSKAFPPQGQARPAAHAQHFADYQSESEAVGSEPALALPETFGLPPLRTRMGASPVLSSPTIATEQIEALTTPSPKSLRFADRSKPRVTDWRSLSATPKPEYSSAPEEHLPLFESIAKLVRDYGLEVDARAPEMVVTPHLITLLYQLRPGASVDKVTKWQKELQLYVRRSARIYHHVPRGAIAFEVVRTARESWTFSHAVGAFHALPNSVSSLAAPLGITSLGELRSWDLFEGGPGMLVAGASGSGKSNFLGALALSLILQHSPKTLQFTLCDVKGVDFNLLALAPDYVSAHETEPDGIADALERLGVEMRERLEALRSAGLRRWQDFSDSDRPGPYLLVLADEFADLVDSDEGPRCTALIKQLAQKGRAAGISVVICTQYPRADILPSPISANLNTRVAFRLQSDVQSRVVLERGGAEELQGRGDCLVRFADGTVERLLVPFIDVQAEEQLRHFFSGRTFEQSQS